MTRPRRRQLLALGPALALTGCANGVVATHAPDDVLLRTRLDFVDLDLQPIPDDELRRPLAQRTRLRYVRAPDPLELEYHAVPGRLAGPQTELLYRQRLKRWHYTALEPETQLDFAINLGLVQRGLARFAAPFAARPEEQGLRVAPGGVRLARLVLAPRIPVEPLPYAALCGILDRAGGREHVLVYVDRPAAITGEVDLRRTATFVDAHPMLRQRFAGIFAHALELPRAGLHWLQIEPEGAGRFLVRRATAPQAPLVYVLDGAARLG